MIYIYSGNDNKKKNIVARKHIGDSEQVFLSSNEEKVNLLNYANSNNLFGGRKTVIIENFLKENESGLNNDDLESLKKSDTLFIFLEDKFLVADEKKYKKFTESIEKFDLPVAKQIPKLNAFAIADAFARKDKISAWTLYLQLIEHGEGPEAICGMLFWKIKTMLITNSNTFSKDKLKSFSSELVDLYHGAHRGERDFVIGLEQFILNSLS